MNENPVPCIADVLLRIADVLLPPPDIRVGNHDFV
jgi:hypothetical protein